jgi:hypothetical protein
MALLIFGLDVRASSPPMIGKLTFQFGTRKPEDGQPPQIERSRENARLGSPALAQNVVYEV